MITTDCLNYIQSVNYLKEHFNRLVQEIKSEKIVIEEILRQRELRIERHRREWHCDPHNMNITSEDLSRTHAYLNTVEDWDDEYHEERITREDD